MQKARCEGTIRATMRLHFTIALIITSCAFALGQEKTAKVAYYEKKERLGPFFMRWYWGMTGNSTYAWKETLELRSDSTFVYHYQGGDCGTFDHLGSGTWTRTGKQLILRPNNNCYMLKDQYVIDKRKLYISLDPSKDGKVAFKRK